MNFLELMKVAAPILLKGTGYTLIFAFAAMLGGLLLGFVIAVARIVPSRLSRWPASVYVSLMRGTPLLVQVFIIYYGLPGIGISFDPLTAGILALSLNAGAYISESLRGAILGIARGQWSAGYSLGLTYWQNLYYVVLPQALREGLEPVGGDAGRQGNGKKVAMRHGALGRQVRKVHPQCLPGHQVGGIEGEEVGALGDGIGGDHQIIAGPHLDQGRIVLQAEAALAGQRREDFRDQSEFIHRRTPAPDAGVG